MKEGESSGPDVKGIRAFKVYFEFFGKNMVTTVYARNEAEAVQKSNRAYKLS